MGCTERGSTRGFGTPPKRNPPPTPAGPADSYPRCAGAGLALLVPFVYTSLAQCSSDLEKRPLQRTDSIGLVPFTPDKGHYVNQVYGKAYRQGT